LGTKIKEVLKEAKLIKNNLTNLVNILNYIRLKNDNKYAINLNIAIKYTEEEFHILNKLLGDYKLSVSYDFLEKYIKNGEISSIYSYSTFCEELAEFLLKPLDTMPLYINYTLWKGTVAKWRIAIGK